METVTSFKCLGDHGAHGVHQTGCHMMEQWWEGCKKEGEEGETRVKAPGGGRWQRRCRAPAHQSCFVTWLCEALTLGTSTEGSLAAGGVFSPAGRGFTGAELAPDFLWGFPCGHMH